jgi:hypothetical protein
LCGLRTEITEVMIDNASERFARFVVVFRRSRRYDPKG